MSINFIWKQARLLPRAIGCNVPSNCHRIVPRVLLKIFSCSTLEAATLIAMADNKLVVSCRFALTTSNAIFIQIMPSVSTFKEWMHKGTSSSFRLPDRYVRLRNKLKDVECIFNDLLLDSVRGVCLYLYVKCFICVVYFLKFNFFHRILNKLTVVRLIKKLCNTVAHCYV